MSLSIKHLILLAIIHWHLSLLCLAKATKTRHCEACLLQAGSDAAISSRYLTDYAPWVLPSTRRLLQPPCFAMTRKTQSLRAPACCRQEARQSPMGFYHLALPWVLPYTQRLFRHPYLAKTLNFFIIQA